MNLRINGEKKSFDESRLTILNLLESLELSIDHIAVEVNGDIIQKSLYSEKLLSNEDIVEIVSFVGGGIDIP